jgi:cytochrome c biogenesis protein
MTDTATPSRSLFSTGVVDINELLGSMRFAVSLLIFICVASLMGTVLVQNRSSSQYIDQFGPFWFELFDKFSIWHVYNSWWFLLIMAFLVMSTSLCLVRNTPKMWRDMRSFREHVRASSLRAFTHRYTGETAADCETTVAAVHQMLAVQGFAVREKRDASGILLAAKKGSVNRLGYIFAHAAIVIICMGGLLDSELPVRLQVWLFDKQPIQENMLIAQVPDNGRLSVSNPSFRSSVLIAEGSRATAAVIMVNDGALVQPLPFTLELKKFIVDYYSTGMPSRFVSEVTVTDPDDGKHFDATIEVNQPLRFKGVTVYQSSFDDGGSRVDLLAYPLIGHSVATTPVNSQVGEEQSLPSVAARLIVTAVRPINVEDFSSGLSQTPPLNFGEHVAAVTGSAAGKHNDNLRNVGPAIEYRLLDSAGQAHEFKNYMQSVLLEGRLVMLAGARAHPNEPYRYLRIPIDEQYTVSEFMQLRAALDDPAARLQAAQRFAARSRPDGSDRAALERATARALDTFAQAGLQGIAQFLQTHTPPDQLAHAADIVVRLIGASIDELRAVARARASLPALAQDDAARAEAADWSRLAIAALSDLKLYPAPVFLTLENFDHVPASIFQVTRTPGKNIVYLGCLLLVTGVFSMFYIRDHRVWVWVRARSEGGAAVQAAMTSQKRTLDFNREFERFTAALRQQLGS